MKNQRSAKMVGLDFEFGVPHRARRLFNRDPSANLALSGDLDARNFTVRQVGDLGLVKGRNGFDDFIGENTNRRYSVIILASSAVVLRCAKKIHHRLAHDGSAISPYGGIYRDIVGNDRKQITNHDAGAAPRNSGPIFA